MFTPENLTITESINELVDFTVHVNLNVADEQSGAVMSYRIESVTIDEIDEFAIIDGRPDILVTILSDGFNVKSRFRDLFDRQHKFTIVFERVPVTWEHCELLNPYIIADNTNIVKIVTQSKLPFKLGDKISIGKSMPEVYTNVTAIDGAALQNSTELSKIIAETTEKNKVADNYEIIGIDGYLPGLEYSSFYIKTASPIAAGQYRLLQNQYSVYRVVNRVRHIQPLDEATFVEEYTGVYSVKPPAAQRSITFNLILAPVKLVSSNPLIPPPDSWDTITATWSLTLLSSENVSNQLFDIAIESGSEAQLNKINNHIP